MPEAATMPAIEGTHLTVTPRAAQGAVNPGNRFRLLVEIAPRGGVHVYAPGAGGEYRPVALRVREAPFLVAHEPPYPPPQGTWAGPLGEAVPVYTGPVRIAVEITLGTRQALQPVLDSGGTLVIEGTVALQACSDELCWPPEEISVAWTLQLNQPDLERPPEALQRERLLER